MMADIGLWRILVSRTKDYANLVFDWKRFKRDITVLYGKTIHFNSRDLEGRGSTFFDCDFIKRFPVPVTHHDMIPTIRKNWLQPNLIAPSFKSKHFLNPYLGRRR